MINITVRTINNFSLNSTLRSGDSYRMLPFSSGSDAVVPSTGNRVLIEGGSFRLLQNGDKLLLG